MANLSNDEKLRILSARATPTPDGKHRSWELVAEETRHSKATVLEVDRWFQGLPWDEVRDFPQAIKRLRKDCIEHLDELYVTSERIDAYTTKVGPVPDVPTRYAHPLGKKPTSVWVTPTTYGTPTPIFVGSVTDRYIQLQAASNHSGAIGIIRLEYDPSPGSVAWLKPYSG